MQVFHDAEIRKQAFKEKCLKISGRIRRPFQCGIREGAQHQAQNVLIADPLERLGRESLAFCAVLARDVAEDDLGVGRLFRLEDPAQRVDAIVRHFDGAEVDLATEPGWHFESSQRVEDGRLAGAGEADEAHLHGIIPGASAASAIGSARHRRSRQRERRVGSAAPRPRATPCSASMW